MEKIARGLYELALKAQSVEELAGIAEGAGFTLTEDEVKGLYEHLHGEGAERLSDDELEGVAGGCRRSDMPVNKGQRCIWGDVAWCGADCTYYTMSTWDGSGICSRQS